VSIRLLVFDCDGVLFESGDANIGFYNEVLRRVGEPAMTSALEEKCHAMSSPQFFEVYFADRPDMAARVREMAIATDYEPFYSLMHPAPGLHDLLDALRAEGYDTAMATNRGRTVGRLLELFELDSRFDFSIGTLDVELPKPAPDMLLSCLERFALEAREAVYLGDQDCDLQAATAAGLHFVGVGPVVAHAQLSIEAIGELPGLLTLLNEPGGSAT